MTLLFLILDFFVILHFHLNLLLLYRMLAQYISKFPIAKSTSKIQDEVIKRVQKCLNSNSTLNEEDINRIVYQIYGFESSEIAHIENLI